jgi:hypothetical protein
MGISSMLSAINPYAGLIGAGVSALGQYRANRETRASTGRQIAFQERMSNTAHQRQMADLKKAGINPMLSAKLGGASSPAGASYQASNIGAAAVDGYGKVSSAKQAQAQTARTKVDTKIRQRDLDYLVKEGVSEYSVKYTVKNIFGSKMLNAIEMAFQGKTDQLSQPYRAAANLMMETLRKAGWVKGNTVINQKTEIEETENIFGFLFKQIGPGSKFDPHTWSK